MQRRYLALVLAAALLTLAVAGGSLAQAAPAATLEPAKPKPTPRPTTPPPPVPARIQISAIKLDQRILSVGLDKNRIPIVPNHDVGWYNLSARPGQGENIVLWGHVLRFRNTPKKPAPFARLKELKVGDRIVLYDARGTAHRYEVSQQVWVTPDQVEYILPVGSERLTLVSCIGDKVISNGEVVEMTNRLITIAEPVR
jgi:LPXTG-site transpeptidase (sortase) family protein